MPPEEEPTPEATNGEHNPRTLSLGACSDLIDLSGDILGTLGAFEEWGFDEKNFAPGNESAS